MSTAWRILLFLSISLDVILSLTHADFVNTYIYITCMSLRNSITRLMPSVPFIQPLSFFLLVESLLMFVSQLVHIRSPFQIQRVSIDRGRQVLQHIAHLGVCWHDANSLIAPGFMSCHRLGWNNLQVTGTRSYTSYTTPCPRAREVQAATAG